MSELLPLVDFSIMASPGQKKGACGHIMASFDKHSRCARCREKGQGDDPCVQNLQCDFCSVLTPEQVLKLSTPTYKLRKEKAKAKEVLVDPSSVVVLDTQPEQEPAVSVSSAPDLSLPVPQFKKDLQELDEKWATRMARLEALITLGHRSSPSVQQNPTFSPVKVPVSHAAPAGALSQTPFFVSTSASSSPAGPAVGPDEPRDQDVSFADRQSPLQNLYPEAEPMFKHPAPVATVSSAAMSASSQSAFQQPSSGSGPVTFRDVNPQETFEEGELSDAEESPDLETSDPDWVLSEDQNYRETVRGVRAFMGWTHIPDLEFSPQSRTDNPWAGHRSQPVGKISVDLPAEDWLCRKLETLNLVLIEGYPSKSSDPGGLHVDQFLRPPKSQNRWYGIHPAEPTDLTRPGKSVNSWPNDAAKINSSFPRISTISSTSPQPPSRPLSQDTMRKWEKAAKESSYICNQSAGFNRCITKIQDAFQEQLHILQSELKKGKSSVKAQGALDELLYLSSFNQNVSFAMGKSLQHLADFTFVQMANLTLLRRDSYLEAVKPGIKPDTFNSLRNCPLNGYGLFPDAAIRNAEDEINQLEASRRTSQPGPGRGGFAGRGRKQRYQPYSTGWKPQDTAKTTSQAGKELPAWKAFGSRNRGRGRGRGGQPGRGTKMAHEKTQYK